MITVAQHWAEDQRAKINYGEGKSEIIVFNETSASKSQRGPTPWIAKARFPHDKVVREVDHFKCLRFTLDSKMEMNKHCNDIIKKIKFLLVKFSSMHGSSKNRSRCTTDNNLHLLYGNQ